MKSCIYSLVIKNHFISLMLRPNLYRKVLTRSVAMNEQYLTSNLSCSYLTFAHYKGNQF